ncbi:preprotein translocase subunit SecE [Luteococcus sp. Sow4_B9]|uniref:preprotein translocase subunit SecE n=1 Tax=Luteococcus sp. Sow4_B9 TaxID=3438792 RepID=UPI003F98BCF4
MTDDQTRKSFDDAASQSDPEEFLDVPSGEQLAAHTDDVAPGEIVDPEAEELRGEPVQDDTPGHADPEDMVIDDPEQLAAAERLAAQARSSRPKRRSRAEASAAGAAEESEPVETAGSVETSESAEGQAAAQPVVPRPVRRQSAKAQELESAAPQGRSASAKKSSKAAAAQPKRTTPVAFVGQSADELRKVIWPTGAQLSQYFVVVLLFVLFIVAYVGLLDPAFGWVMLKFLGK